MEKQALLSKVFKPLNKQNRKGERILKDIRPISPGQQEEKEGEENGREYRLMNESNEKEK